MIVTGGCYWETCEKPEWYRIFGSGVRAAIAISSWDSEVEFFGYAGPSLIADAKATLGTFGINAHLREISEDIWFEYLHPLSRPDQFPATPRQSDALQISGNEVLRFGMVEGSAIVESDYAVYDPQGNGVREPFAANGSTTKHLALVLNEGEALAMASASEIHTAAGHLIHNAGVEVVVVKRGTKGAFVQTATSAHEIPAYRSSRVFKIGSGDVFSAAFAHFWAAKRLAPEQAADMASRSVAAYVETATLPLPARIQLSQREPLKSGCAGKIYLAGPFFTTGQLLFIEELRDAVEGLGASVFSPFHDVGMGLRDSEIVERDLEGLESSNAVLAVLDGHDPGTLFEVGHARARGIPVVALAENTKTSDLTMFLGAGCEVCDDLCTAAYKSVWASI